MIDPVRFLSNRSSGRLGYELAKAARRAGACVTLVSGPTALKPPPGVRLVPVVSARAMYRATLANAQQADVIICAAAVADWRPRFASRRKIKKVLCSRFEVRGSKFNLEHRTSHIALELVPNPDILATLGRRKRRGQYLVGFALESERLLENAWAKLRHKRCDCVIANPVPSIGAAKHRATLLFRNGRAERLPPLSKRVLAQRIIRIVWRKIATA